MKELVLQKKQTIFTFFRFEKYLVQLTDKEFCLIKEMITNNLEEYSQPRPIRLGNMIH